MVHKFTKPLNLLSAYATGMTYDELSALEDLETSLYLLQPRDIDVDTANSLIRMGLMERLVRVDKRHIKTHPRLCFITQKGREKLKEIQMSHLKRTNRHKETVPISV